MVLAASALSLPQAYQMVFSLVHGTNLTISTDIINGSLKRVFVKSRAASALTLQSNLMPQRYQIQQQQQLQSKIFHYPRVKKSGLAGLTI